MSDLLPDQLPPGQRRGRGVSTNPANRYESQSTEQADDGWDIAEEVRPLRTTVTIDHSRSIIARNTSPDVPFDRSINPYRGCEHGCVYCFARPTHAQLGFSPGLDFETRLMAKPRAAELLATALRKPGYTVAPIAIGTNTDPYQPIEREHRVMRRVLEVLWEHRHPVCITTKGSLLMRDADLIGKMARAGLASVTISLTTLDNRLSRAMEPRAAAPGKRISMIRALADQGVPVSANLAPVIPSMTDHEIETLVEAAAAAGAKSAGMILLRLPLEVAPLFRDWLAREFPDRAARVMGRVRETQGGKDYDAAWGKRLRGEGAHANLIQRRFRLALERSGLSRRRISALRCDLFRVPPRSGDQLSLDL
ncbi:PA0069 family radical SAM protein [Rhodobacteraceae bacterium NNCM2]|nr:PA0069 family radical SAM protein [Coraliihabitans acroporae]